MPSKKAAPKRKSSKSKSTTPAQAQPAPTVETSTKPVAEVEQGSSSAVQADPQLAMTDLVLDEEFSQALAGVQALQQKLSNLKTHLRALHKKHSRNLKQAQKLGKRNRAGRGPRQPSGFVKPTRISKELAKFLGKKEGTEMARTEVTKEINAYIRANHLQDPKNGRIINADSALSKLLSLQDKDELTYFNLQKYMSQHFAKASSAATSSA